ncbi:hypothetical protein IJD34_08900 [bacterium]|nr:hypothetical protein [bacterium]
MNITQRKLAMLEKELIRKRESSFSTSPQDESLYKAITDLMNRVRVI